MSEESTPSRAEETPGAASNSGGEERGFRKTFRDKEAAAIGAVAGEPRFRGRRRRKVSYLTINKIDFVDYKEVNILKRFINDRGKILSSKNTGNTAKQQRMIARAIRRAREMALLPFVVTEMAADRPFRPRGPREYSREDRGDRYERGDRGDRGNAEAPAE